MDPSAKNLQAKLDALIPSQFLAADNLRALLSAVAAQVQGVDDALMQVLLARSIDVATGAQLDGIGDNLIEAREGQNDDEYRIRLRAKMLVIRSSGLTEEIYEIVRAMFGTNAYIDFRPLGAMRGKITIGPYTAVSTLAATQAARMVNKATPLGAWLAVIYTADINNVFRFNNTSTLGTSSAHGFGNAAHTTGGKFAGVSL